MSTPEPKPITPLPITHTTRDLTQEQLELVAQDIDTSLNEKGQTLLMLACLNHDIKVVKHCLNLGANPNKNCASSGRIALQYAIYGLAKTESEGGDLRFDDYSKIVTALLEANSNIDFADDLLPSLLMISAFYLDVKNFKLCLTRQVDIKKRDSSGATALDHILRRIQLLESIIRTDEDGRALFILISLLQHGAQITTNNGLDVLMCLATRINGPTYKYPKELLIELLKNIMRNAENYEEQREDYEKIQIKFINHILEEEYSDVSLEIVFEAKLYIPQEIQSKDTSTEHPALVSIRTGRSSFTRDLVRAQRITPNKTALIYSVIYNNLFCVRIFYSALSTALTEKDKGDLLDLAFTSPKANMGIVAFLFNQIKANFNPTVNIPLVSCLSFERNPKVLKKLLELRGAAYSAQDYQAALTTVLTNFQRLTKPSAFHQPHRQLHINYNKILLRLLLSMGAAIGIDSETHAQIQKYLADDLDLSDDINLSKEKDLPSFPMILLWPSISDSTPPLAYSGPLITTPTELLIALEQDQSPLAENRHVAIFRQIKSFVEKNPEHPEALNILRKIELQFSLEKQCIIRLIEDRHFVDVDTTTMTPMNINMFFQYGGTLFSSTETTNQLAQQTEDSDKSDDSDDEQDPTTRALSCSHAAAVKCDGCKG